MTLYILKFRTGATAKRTPLIFEDLYSSLVKISIIQNDLFSNRIKLGLSKHI